MGQNWPIPTCGLLLKTQRVEFMNTPKLYLLKSDHRASHTKVQ